MARLAPCTRRAALCRAVALLLAGLLCCQCASHRSAPSPVRMNDAPPTWTCRDGKVLPYSTWPVPSGPPRGVVICVHGLSGAASDFWPAGEALPAQGFAVYALELRGQGHDPDPRARGDIRSSGQWRADLLDFTALVRQRHPAVPVFWFGESLGALIVVDALASLPEERNPVTGFILASPVVALRPNLKLDFWKNLTFRTVLRICPCRRLSLEALGNSEVRVTSHTTHREQMQRTPHYVPDFTLRLFAQIEKLIRQSGSAARKIKAPALILYTPNDALTPREGVERFFDRLASSDKERQLFADSFHLILHDKERPVALRRLADWLSRQTRL